MGGVAKEQEKDDNYCGQVPAFPNISLDITGPPQYQCSGSFIILATLYPQRAQKLKVIHKWQIENNNIFAIK